MRLLVFVAGLLLTQVCHADDAYLETLPSPETVLASVTGDGEVDLAVRQVVALQAFDFLISEKRPGGVFSHYSDAEQEKRLEYMNLAWELIEIHTAKYPAFEAAHGRLRMDNDYLLSVIREHVPDEVPYMEAGIERVNEVRARHSAEERWGFSVDSLKMRWNDFVDAAVGSIPLLIFVAVTVVVVIVSWSSTRLKTFSGRLKRYGSGRKDSRYGITRRSFIEIGDRVIKRVMCTEIVDSNLDVGTEMELYIGRLFHGRFLYAVRREDGRLFKMGFSQILLSAAIKTFLLLITTQLLLDVWMPFGEDSQGEDIPLKVSFVWTVIAGYYGMRSVRAIMNYISIKQSYGVQADD